MIGVGDLFRDVAGVIEVSWVVPVIEELNISIEGVF